MGCCWAGTLLVVLLFKSSESLGGAYGIAVSGTMLVTTILLYRVAIDRWRWPRAVAILMVAGFGAIDSIFLASNSLKIFEGGWFPIAIGWRHGGRDAVLRWGSMEVRHRLEAMSMPLEEFIGISTDGGGAGAGHGRVADQGRPRRVAHASASMPCHSSVMHKTVVLMTFLPDRRPRVPFGERHSLERLGPWHLSRPGAAWLHAGPPTSPRTLENCRILGLRRRSRARALLYRPRNHRCAATRISAMPAVPFAVFAFLRGSRAARRTSSGFRTRACPRWATRVEI